MYNNINELPREKLIELLGIYAKNWLAHDGLWYQSVDKKLGTDEAMEHNINAQKVFEAIEARRIKEFLNMPEFPGIKGLEQALRFRLYASLNQDEVITDGNTLIYRMVKCRVQSARKRKNMPYHPCKDVGIVEYSVFASGIDSRIKTECISCYPDITDESCACSWKFTLEE